MRFVKTIDAYGVISIINMFIAGAEIGTVGIWGSVGSPPFCDWSMTCSQTNIKNRFLEC